jgi:pimeloyl-ACP methyl ester carboxylesterase
MAPSPDIVVLVPGITGSVLEKNGKEIWGASAEAVLRGLLSGGGSIRDLRLGDDPPDVDDLGDGVRATRLVNDVHVFPQLWKIDGYTKVARRLREALELEPGKTFFEFPYDWRRDNRVAARKLGRACETWLRRRRAAHPDAKVTFVAHSMGGLICRYYIEVLGGWRDTRALVTFGTPYRGSLNALDTLSNGVRKLGLIDLTELARSFTSSYQLLPIYPCFEARGRAIRLKEAAAVPGLDMERVRAADEFHREIERSVSENDAAADGPEAAETGRRERYVLRPVVGIEQPTSQSARVANGRVELLRVREGEDESGDGTVPRVSASPIERGEEQAAFASTRHASLQNADAVLTHVHGVLTAPQDHGRIRAVARPVTLSVDLDDIYVKDEPVAIAVRSSSPGEPLEIAIEHATTSVTVASAPVQATDEEWRPAELAPLPPGAYRAIVRGDPARVEPVADLFVVA